MNILYFYQYFGTPQGSWSTRVYELTKRWVEDGHTVTVITTPYEKSDIKAKGFVSKQVFDGVNVIVINSADSNRNPIWKRVIKAVLFSVMAIFYALRMKYDLAIASSGPITVGLPMLFSKLIRRKKTIFEVRDLWPSGGIELGLIKKKWLIHFSYWFEKVCYNKADSVVTASVGQKRHIANRFPELKIEVIPNASDIDLFGAKTKKELPKWTKGKYLFTHIGSLGLIHNTTYWIKVAKELQLIDKDKNIEMVFIGDGADRQKLENEKERLGLDNLRFLGLMPKSELPVWVQNSTATLFATTANPVQDSSSPNKIFDSFAASVPIVQTSKGWIADLIRNNNCGVNISLDDPREAAKKIIWLTENEELRNQMGANAFQLAKTEYNRDILAKKYLDILSEIVHPRKAKLKIVYFYQYFGTPNGSWSTRVYEFCKRWVENGYEVTIVTSPYYKSDIKADGFISRLKVENINVIVIDAADSNKHSFIRRAINAFVFALMSIYYAIKLDFDVAICSSGPLTIGLPGVVAKKLRKKKLVFEVRDLWPQGSVELGKLTNPVLIKMAYWFEKVCYTNSSLVIPCSVDMESDIVERFPDTKTCVIPNASDSSFYQTPHDNPKVYPDFVKGKDIVLYAGSLGLMDDCMQIIEAAKILNNDNIAIVFAGDGAERDVLEHEVLKHKIKNVFFTGLLPKTDIIKWFFLSKASLITFKDLKVLSSNSPNKMFDSFAAGVPIIQTTGGWIKTMVEEEKCGINAKPYDPQDLANAILTMVENDNLQKEMAANAFRLAKNEFNRDILSEKYMNSITDIPTLGKNQEFQVS